MAKTKIPGGYIADNAITGTHIADNVITSAMLHTSFTVSSSNLSSIDTDNVSEGASNLYFTNARARGAISVSGDLSYNTNTGVISFTNDAGDIESVVAGSGLIGGGTSGDVTLNIGAGTGITVNADDIAVNMSAFDTDNLSEGASNLYFTNARADARIAAATTDDLTEGSTNLYYTTARWDTKMAAADTDDLSEGLSNLYFTNARVESYLDANGITFPDSIKAQFGASNDLQIYHDGSNSYINDTGTGNLYIEGTNLILRAADDSRYLQAIDGVSGYTALYHPATNGEKLSTTGSGIDVTGNIEVSGTVDGRNIATDGTKLDGIEASADVTDTANVTSAGALMDSELTDIASVKALNQGVATSDSPTFVNTTLTGYLRGPSSFTIDPAAYNDDTGTVVIAGNLQVDGTTTTINSTTLSVSDKQVTLGYDATTDAANNQAGIVVYRPETSNAQILWSETNTRFEINRKLNISQDFSIDASGTNDTRVEIGSDTASNHYAYIDLIGDATYTNYGLRIIRNNGGANTSSFIYHRGTGNFNIETQEAASILLKTAGTTALTLNSSQNAEFAGAISSGPITITTGAVPLSFVESGHTGNGQYWRMPLDSGNIRFDVSTSGGASFTTYDEVFRLSSDGSIDVQGAQMFDTSGNINTTKTIDSGAITSTGTSTFGISNIKDGSNPLIYFRDASDTIEGGIGFGSVTDGLFRIAVGNLGLITDTVMTINSSGNAVFDGTISSGNITVNGTNTDSGFLSGSSAFTTNSYIYTKGIINEGETGAAPAAIVFGNGSTYGADQISLITSGNTAVYIGSNSQTTFNYQANFNDWVYIDVAGQNLVLQSDTSARETIEWQQGTTRLWTLDLKSGGHLDFVSSNADDELRYNGSEILASGADISVGTISSGNITVGTSDNTGGVITVHGNGTGNAEGGEIQLKMAADHDTTYDHYRLDIYQDDFRIGRAGLTDFYIFQDGKVKVENNFEIGTGGTITSDYFTTASGLATAYVGTTDAKFRTGRGANEYFEFRVTDGNGHITYVQDETGAVNHQVNFGITSSSTGLKQFNFSRDLNVNGGSVLRMGGTEIIDASTRNMTNIGTISSKTILMSSATGTYQAGSLGYTDSNWGFLYRPPQAGALGAHNFEATDGTDLLTIQESGNATFTGTITVNGNNILMDNVQARVKYSVWDNNTYGIGMQSNYTFGGLANDFAMTFQMNDSNGRGFWWGDSTHTNAQGAMALTTNGYLTVARGIRIGYGETDTTTPSSALDVGGNISSGQMNPTTSADATPAIIATNSGGVGSTIQRWVGDTDSLEVKNPTAGDYKISNSQQDNAIVFYDGTGGVEILYGGTARQEWDSTGGTNLVGGSYKVGGTAVIDSNANLVNIGTIDSGAISGSSWITVQDYVQHYGFLYSRNNLRVLNAAGNDWVTWATRANSTFNLDVGTIDSGTITSSGNGEFTGTYLYTSGDIRVGTSTGATNQTGVIKNNGTTYGLGLFSWADANPIFIGGSEVNFRTESGSAIALKSNGQTFLDASRNLTNIGTYSGSGDMTISKSGTPTLTVATSATSSNDALIQIRGARTASSTSDIAKIKFDNKTTSAYTMAEITARDPSGSHTLGRGSLIFRTSDGGTLSDALLIARTGGANFYNDLTTNGNFTADGTITSSDITISNAGPTLYLTDTDNNPDWWIKNGNGNLRFIDATNSVDVLTLTASGGSVVGNLGIGTSSPVAKLDVLGTNAGPTVYDYLYATNSGIRIHGDEAGMDIVGTDSNNHASSLLLRNGNEGFAFINNSTSNRLELKSFNATADAFTVHSTGGNVSNLVDLLTLEKTGNVGIGTSTPSVRFHAVSGGVGSQFHFQSPTPIIRGIDSNLTTRYWQIGGENGSCNIAIDPGGAQANSTFGVTIDGQQALYIDSDDRNYINTTSNPTPTNATGHLNVLSDLGDGLNIKHTINGNNTINIWQTGSTQHSAIAFYKGDSQTFRGAIYANTGTGSNSIFIGAASDYRLKENVVPMSNATSRVMAMNPVQFDWIESGVTSEGFLAHELAEQCPDAVVGEKDALYSNGDIKTQTVDHSRLTPLLVKTIQEQQALIESLQTRIEALEGE